MSNHAAIFRLMTDSIPFYFNDSEGFIHLPFHYNFDDYAGNKDWSNTFVTKLLTSHKGNCHSLPILYKLIAEEMRERLGFRWLLITSILSYETSSRDGIILN